MIYDHIRNLSLYKGLSPALDAGLEFIGSVSKSIPNGVSYLQHDVKVFVSEYATRLKNENGYEAHRKYIDIQFPIVGLETVKCCPIESLVATTDYNEENDYILFADKDGSKLTIGDGYFLVLFPDDGHMPQLCVEEPENIKKITLKVPAK